jgi:hypothetical protein
MGALIPNSVLIGSDRVWRHVRRPRAKAFVYASLNFLFLALVDAALNVRIVRGILILIGNRKRWGYR